MGYMLDDFQSQLLLAIGRFSSDPNATTELNQIRILLGGDATIGDVTLEIPPSGLVPGNPFNSPFVNEILKLINRGKGGNLSTIAMANIIGGVAPPGGPINTTPPALTYVSGGGGPGNVGSQYAAGAGVWNPSTGNTRTNQWYSGGSPIAGATVGAYTAADTDSGNSIYCTVTMTNAGGSGSANSNSVAIA